jgi:hypothetical protein
MVKVVMLTLASRQAIDFDIDHWVAAVRGLATMIADLEKQHQDFGAYPWSRDITIPYRYMFPSGLTLCFLSVVTTGDRDILEGIREQALLSAINAGETTGKQLALCSEMVQEMEVRIRRNGPHSHAFVWCFLKFSIMILSGPHDDDCEGDCVVLPWCAGGG